MKAQWKVKFRAPVWLGAVLALVACEAPASPMIGVSTSGSMRAAALLAVEDAATAGGVVPGTVVRAEATADAAPALDVAEEFVAVPGLAAVVGHSNSSASLAASQVYGAHHVVQISPTATASAYSEAGPFSFRMVPPDDRQGRFLAQLVVDSLSDATVALLYVNDDYGRGLRSSLIEALAGLQPGWSFVLDLPFSDVPVKPAVARAHMADAVAASGAEAIVWIGRSAPLDHVLPTLRDRLGPIPIYGSDGLSTARLHGNADGRWDGVRCVDFVDLDATSRGRAFADRYRERFGRDATGPDALAYDASALLSAAIADGASAGPDVREYLMSLGRSRPPFEGVTGPIRFDSRGDVERSYHLCSVAGRA